MNWYKKAQTASEMENFFEERTKKHINLVQKYCKKIQEYDNKRFKNLIEIGKQHDKSKFESPEKEPYIYITWDYKCKEDGTNFKIPESIKEKTNQATQHHVKNNKHHPDFYSDLDKTINREDRDKPPQKIIDATKMPEIYLAEMVADWLAMSEEKNTDPIDWADKNVGVRWNFSERQKDLIYELINAIWKKD